MAAGVTAKLWSIADMVQVIDNEKDLQSGALTIA
jgi:hypothetical protein